MTSTNKILIGLTSHRDLGGLRSTGYYLPEAAHPWQVFTDAGFTVEFASVAGGEPPVDDSGTDLTDPVQQAFTERVDLTATPRFADLDPAGYDAVLFAGGHGAMWDFPSDAGLTGFTRDLYERGGVVAAVCHGPAALVGVTLANGTPLVHGRQVAGFTNSEESAAGLTEVVPFLLQDKLAGIGAEHSGAADWQPHVVTDGRLVTGQNPASSTGVAEAVLRVLKN